MLPSSGSHSVQRGEAEVNVLGLHPWSCQDTVSSMSTEVKTLTDKLKDIEVFLSQSSVCEMSQSQNPSLQVQHPFIAPYQNSSEYGNVPQAFDRALLDFFHRIPSQPDFGEKWSLLQLPQKLEEMLLQLGTLQRKLIEGEILVWKREHQLSKNGFKAFSKNLNDIQKFCEEFLEAHITLHKNFQLLYESLVTHHSQAQNPTLSHTFQTLKSHAVALLSEFLNATLVVESEPSEVIKINTRFAHSVALRHLLGHKLYLKSQYISIKASIISELTAREQVEDKNTHRGVSRSNINPVRPSGVIIPESVKMELVDHKFVGHFKNLQLRNIDRKSKKVKNTAFPTNPKQSRSALSHRRPPSDLDEIEAFPQQETPSKEILSSTVTDEKFCLHFQTEIRCCMIDFNVWTISLPVVVVTHGIQEPQAYATMAWDNSFGCIKDSSYSLVNRIPFTVPMQVPWESLAEMLSIKFEQATGKGLEPFQLESLKFKLIPELQYHVTPDSNAAATQEVSFTRMSKSTLSGCPFSFWEWFYSSMKLVEKHALSNWKNGAIYGFIARRDAEILLQGSSPGVFLVRFSDTVLGGISFTFVGRDGHVHSITPLTSKNLSFRSLSDSIWDLDTLTHVYPNTPKVKVFPQPNRSGFSSPPPTSNSATTSQNVTQTGESSRLAMNFRLSDYVMCVPKITLPPKYC